MKEMLKNLKADVILSAVLCIALGMVFLIWPTAVPTMFCKVIGIILIAMGVGHILQYFMDRIQNRIGLATGFVILLLGVFIFSNTAKVLSIIPIVIGVLLLMHGIEDVKLALEVKENGAVGWWSGLIIAAVNIAVGVLLIWNAYQTVQIAMWLVGLALVYDGVSDLFIVSRVSRAAKAAAQDAEAVDVDDWKE